jgi:hypothetical protein
MLQSGTLLSMRRSLHLCILFLISIQVGFALQQKKVDRLLILKKEHKLELLSGKSIVKTYSVAIG